MKQITTCLLSLLLCILHWKSATVQSAPVQSAPVQSHVYPGMSTEEYLYKYGYICHLSDAKNYNMKKTALRKFQNFYHIPMTGRVDLNTRKIMSEGRCGVKDFEAEVVNGVLTFGEVRRQKRYTLIGAHWDKKDLTYFISSPYRPSKNLNRKQVKRIIKKSFEAWAKVTSLTFKEVNNENADIVFKFVRGPHADDIYPFDGPGGRYAHAFPPNEIYMRAGLAGAIHFDDDELFALGDREGAVDFYWLAVHEIGHTLGLQHSDIKEAAMFSMKKVFKGLHADDIKGISMIYGKSVSGPIKSINPYISPYVCRVTSFDAIVYETRKAVTYFFKGEYFWERNAKGIVSVRKPIRYWWKNLEFDIDAAYTKLDGRIMFFKGSKYWLFNGVTLEDSGNLEDRNIPSELSGMNAAMVYGHYQNTYFFKNGQFWLYNEYYWRIDGGYPKSSAQSWGKELVDIDSALTWSNGKTYIFKGTGFYEYDNEAGQVKNRIPRNTLKIWLGC